MAKPRSSGMCAARQRSRSWHHSLGRYSSRSSSACPAPVAQAAITPTWQGKTPPSVPVNCRATPAEDRPFFANPVSSTTSTPHPSGPAPTPPSSSEAMT
ncbi:hypothetical protein QMK19_39930 [Streptomyces sp. H10-C2]|uniref:hypothetical protein n=1 Tax=unclassified Streptomyces TaxID=2593676 RepID=UPI0024B8E1F5|nr:MULTISPECIES: hypothetical protein [unclassified Streptomyces]MDJ0347066.1 hypothetical protein [Streptomyces sp. PH10-H1]MDJ0375593.1 hypothetical protein [Streptomyces sp. H10-C2]